MHRWTMSLNVVLSTIAVLALVGMINYLAARHFSRVSVAARSQVEFSPLTKRTLDSLTNVIKVIIYFDKDDALYDSVWSMLKEYKYANPRILVETVDYLRDPAAAQLIKTKYGLSEVNDKNVIIFDGAPDKPGSEGQRRLVYQGELSELDMSKLMSGQSREIRRTHFKGEMLFTSALQHVSAVRPLKAYFVQGHAEHNPDSNDKLMGYSKFAGVLKDNNIKYEALTLYGSGDIPADCSLLIIAGPHDAFLGEEVDKVERYLKQGGRLLILFNWATAKRATGLEKLIARWGVDVGSNVVVDRDNSLQQDNDILVSHFSDHPLTKPLLQGRGIYMVLPRSIARMPKEGSSDDAPKVEVLATTGPNGRVHTDIQENPPAIHPRPEDYVGTVPLIAAIEKGTIRGISADRGSTRIVVVGDSYFLRNGTIENVANFEFASYAINWLLARNEFLLALPARPITEYKLSMTQSQRAAVSWILLAGMPGSVLVMGLLVWLRRRT
jgi:ABC-type uncharacterized transport system involved in gliding motility auxiliary subunit